jgi:hypothetical protein
MPKGSDIVSAAVGVGAALAVDHLVGRRLPRRRVMLQAAGLTAAAVIYPAARARRTVSLPVVRELGALTGFGALSSAAARNPDTASAARWLAAGWTAHAAFDFAHDGGEHSLIPAWYPALCAGYDLATAAKLLLGA